jgi:hypothetical protein
MLRTACTGLRRPSQDGGTNVLVKPTARITAPFTG